VNETPPNPGQHSAETPADSRCHTYEARLQRAVQLGTIALLVAVGLGSFDRARRGQFDFEHFYRDAEYVWKHGELSPPHVTPLPPREGPGGGSPLPSSSDEDRRLPFYLPVVSLALSPLTAFGRVPAALIWAAAQVAALGFSLRELRRWLAPAAASRAPWAELIALVLFLPAIFEATRFNQLSFFILALVLGAVRTLDTQQSTRAGVLFGLATVLKLLPGVFALWLVLKRRWWALLAWMVTVAATTALPPLIAFGPQRALAYHQQWWDENVHGDAGRSLLNPALRAHFIDHRNQSIGQVLARLMWREHPYRAPVQIADLPPATCAALAQGIAALLLFGLAWSTRRPWSQLPTAQRHAEAAVFAIAMLVLSPLLRQYYLVWAGPALWLLASDALATGRARLARCGLAVWLIGMVLWIWPLPRTLGAHLVMLIALAVLVLINARYPVNAVAPVSDLSPPSRPRPQGE
jgi:hypothetical protein